MQYAKFNNQYVLRLDPEEEIVTSLKKLAIKENVKVANVTGIGALNHLVIGVFDTDEKKFIGNTYDETLEATAICGNISTMDGEVYVHIHLTAGRRDGSAIGGHLQEGTISATGELVVTVIDGVVEREFNEEIGLNVFRFEG